MALTYQESKLVRDTVGALRQHGEHITAVFYKNMLDNHPELKSYFNTVNLANGRQPRALTAVILNFAANINHTSELIPKLERMCNRHFSLGVQPEHYAIVGKYLIDAFGQVLGPAMTPAVRAAWTKAYWILAKMLIGRESQLYREHGSSSGGWRKFKVDQKVAESDDVFSFYLVPADGRPLERFKPGQYVSIRLLVPQAGIQSRQYSLSDSPGQDYYRITVERDHGTGNIFVQPKPGMMSNFMIDSKCPGDFIDVSAPAGEFFLDTSNTSNAPLVLISANIGVAPMVSILNATLEHQPTRPISWIQVSRRTAPFKDHLFVVARSRENFHPKFFVSRSISGEKVGHILDDDRGSFNIKKVDPESLYLGHNGTEYFVCGPEDFTTENLVHLKDQGVSRERIKCELFSVGDPELARG